MTLETWIGFALLNFVYSLTPGPNAAVLASSAARAGLRGGVAALCSIVAAEIAWTGVAILVVAGALDIDLLLPGLLNTLGAAALVMLGAQMIGKRCLDGTWLSA
jgi:threonine/homoserine/homoserine lactone efflux protein